MSKFSQMLAKPREIDSLQKMVHVVYFGTFCPITPQNLSVNRSFPLALLMMNFGSLCPLYTPTPSLLPTVTTIPVNSGIGKNSSHSRSRADYLDLTWSVLLELLPRDAPDDVLGHDLGLRLRVGGHLLLVRVAAVAQGEDVQAAVPAEDAQEGVHTEAIGVVYALA